MLSRLHRRTEALDAACLRALGHPNDDSIRHELLSALEWDSSLHPEHANHKIRDLFEQVHDHCVALSSRLRAEVDGAGSAPRRAAEIDHLRQRLADLAHVLEARKSSRAG
jgi:hypothetical protein